MSSSVDERIVAMRFDNEQFERKAHQTMETCRELRESTDMDGVAEQFETIGKVAKKSMNFQNPIKSTGLLSRGLSTLGRVAKGVFSASTFPLRALSAGLQELGYYTRMTLGLDIAGSLVNAGKEVIQAFTIEPMKTGWNEYELKMDSIKTIMTGTEKTFSKMMEAKSPGWVYDEEEHLGYVKNALEELNKYADDTIYSFQEMTRTIGKFTSKGIDLDTSVAAVKGIANLAAYAGQGSTEANRAYYNLSQALGMGYLGTRDWMSIENANMDTLAFKQTLVDLGVALGTLEKQGEKVLVAGNKNVEVTAERLRDTLNEKWVTNDVLLAALQIFSGEEMNAEVLSSLYKLTHEEAEAMIKLGQDAKEAAKQVRTFSKMWDALREAAQSGWAFSWELIVGDSKESLEFWTGLNDRFSGILNRQADSRNAVLREWRGMQQKEDGTWEKIEGAVDGRTVMVEGLNNMLDITETLVGSIGQAWNNVFGKVTGKGLLGMTNRFRDFSVRFKNWLGDAGDSESRISKIRESMEGLFSVFKIGKTALSEFGKRGWNILKMLMPDFDKVMAKTSPLRDWIKKVADQFEKDRSFKNLARNITDGFTKVFSQVRTKLSSKYAQYSAIMSDQGLGGVISQLKEDVKTELAEWGIDITPIENFVNSISGYFTTLKEKFTEVTGIDLPSFEAMKASMKEKLESWGIDTSSFSAFVTSLPNLVTTLKNSFTDATGIDLTSFETFKSSLKKKLESWNIDTSSFGAFVGSLPGFFTTLAESFTTATGIDLTSFESFKTTLKEKLESWGIDLTPVETFVGSISSYFSSLKQKFEEVTGINLSSFSEWWNRLKETISNLGKSSENGEDAVQAGENAQSVLDKVVSVFSNLKETVTSFITWAKEADWEQIGSDLSSVVFQVGGVLAALGFGTLAVGAGKLVNNGAKAVKGLQNAEVSIGGLVEVSTKGGLTGMLDSAKEGLSKVLDKSDKMGKFLLEFGAGIALLAEGMKTISEIPDEKLLGSSGVVAALGSLMVVFDLADKAGSSFIGKSFGKAADLKGLRLTSTISFIAELNTLVGAMQTFDNLKNPDQKWENFGLVAALTALMEVFDLTEKAGSSWIKSGFSKFSSGLKLGTTISFITQLNTLVGAMQTFDNLKNPDQKWENFGLVAALTALMEVFDLTEKAGSSWIKSGFSKFSSGLKLGTTISFITQLNTLVGAMQTFDNLKNPDQRWENFGLVAALTALMEVFDLTEKAGSSWIKSGFNKFSSGLKLGTTISFITQLNTLVGAMQTFDNLKNPDQKWENFGLVAALTALMEVFSITEKASNSWFDAIKPGSTLNRIQLSIGFITQLNTLVEAMETFDTLKNPDQKWENFGLIAALTALMEAVTFVNTHDGLGTKQQIDLSFITNLTAMVMAISSLSKDLVLLDSIENTKEKWSNFGLIAALTALVEAVTFVNSNIGGDPLAALSHLGDMTAFVVALRGMTDSVVELSKVKPDRLVGAVEAVAALTGLVSAFEGLGQLINKSLAPTSFSQGLNEFLGPLSSLLSIGGLLVGLAGLIVGVKLLGEMDSEQVNQGVSTIAALAGIVTAFSILIGTFSKIGVGGSVKGAVGLAAGIASFTVIVGAILYGLSWLTELDPDLLTRIQEGAEVVRAIFEGVGQILAGIVSPIASIFQPKTVTLEDGTEQIINLQDQLHQLGEIGSDLDITGFNNLMDAVEKVQEIANIKINKPTGAASWLAGETSLIEVVSENFDKFGKGIASFGTSIESTDLNRVKEGVGAIQTIAESIQMLRGITGGDLADLTDLLGFKWNDEGIFNFEEPVDWSGFIDFFTNISAPINEGISEGALSIDASPIITAIVAGITGGSDQIRAAIAATLGGIDLGSGDGTADLSDLNLVDGIEEEAKNAWDSVGGYLSQLGLGDVLPEMDLSTITEPLTDMLNTGKETVEGEKDSYLTIFTDLFSTFGLGADANKGNAYSAGSELANGAAAGASANSGRFYALGAAAGRNYLNGFKWASRIGSPSKAMIEMMGYIADGFELGQDRYGGIFTRTGEEEADAYLQAMKEELEPLSLAMAEGIDATPVIRPVIDMSNIEEGMQWMRGAFGRGYGVSLNGNMPALVGRGNVPAAATVNPNQNGSSINRIVDSINSRLDRMQDAMEHWEMVLDSGELVGGIVDKMDKSLGVRAAKARRRG